MKNKKPTAFKAAMGVVRNKRLQGWQFRRFQQGAAATSPVIILALETPPSDPWATCRLFPVENFDGVYRALVRAPEAALVPHGIAFVCRVLPLASDLANWFRDAGATPAETLA
jgi:hypothetical protein